MEVKLERLIEKIKKDGVEEAQKRGEEITGKARENADKIIKKAKDKAEDIINEAQREAESFKTNAEAAVRQAGRDLILSIKEKIYFLFDSLLAERIRTQLTPEYLKEMILRIIEKWKIGDESSWEIMVSAQDSEKLKELLLENFHQRIKDKVEIKVNPAIEKGFRIGLKGENVHCDFTAQSIVESLQPFLNPRLAELMKEG